MSTLSSWTCEPQYKTIGLADNWESRSNSFHAVEYASVMGLIDEDDYELIFRRLAKDCESL